MRQVMLCMLNTLSLEPYCASMGGQLGAMVMSSVAIRHVVPVGMAVLLHSV